MSIQHAQCNSYLAVALLVDFAPPVGLITSILTEGGKQGNERVTTNRFITLPEINLSLSTLCRIGGSQDIVWVGTLDFESEVAGISSHTRANKRKNNFL
jgi:hypothetical protein